MWTTYGVGFITTIGKKEEKLNYIYAGHYNTEKLGIIELGKKVEKYFDIEVNFIDTYNPL